MVFTTNRPSVVKKKLSPDFPDACFIPCLRLETLPKYSLLPRPSALRTPRNQCGARSSNMHCILPDWTLNSACLRRTYFTRRDLGTPGQGSSAPKVPCRTSTLRPESSWRITRDFTSTQTSPAPYLASTTPSAFPAGITSTSPSFASAVTVSCFCACAKASSCSSAAPRPRANSPWRSSSEVTVPEQAHPIGPGPAAGPAAP
mmetsp:Transcript_9113/g.26916  ORF Transcript_9113/g.26916 Transcript_9113/m.26916 type:complete len:202 (-) Transcript_9113:3-608(-)